MKREDFVKAARDGEGQFRLEDVIIFANGAQVPSSGSLKCQKGQFVFDLVLENADDESQLHFEGGFIGRSSFWKIEGRIEGVLPFRAPSVCPEPCGLHNDRVVLHPDTRTIELLATGTDAMDDRQIASLLKDLEEKKEQFEAGETIPLAGPEPEFRQTIFFAVLRDFELLFADQATRKSEENPFLGESWSTSRDTFIGENVDWQYALIQRGPDLHVHLRSKHGAPDLGEPEEQRRLRVFLNSIAFVHGQHAWPSFVEHRRNHRLVLDRIHLQEAAARSSHAVFSERLAYASKPAEWSFGGVLEKCYEFLRQESAFVDEVSRLLYLSREAGSRGVPGRIGALTICSLLESLVRLAYEERVTPLRKTGEAEAFHQAKEQIAEHIESRKTACGESEAYDRLLRIVRSAHAVRIEDQFRAVLDHLGLRSDWWDEIMALWKETRHPLSHRMASGEESEENVKSNMMARSRLAGAINAIVLRLVGYSGPVRLSAFEDKYGRI